MRWTIRAKLTLLVLAVLLPLVAAAGLKFWGDLGEARARADRRVLAAAQVAAARFDEVLIGQIENLEALASTGGIERLDDQALAVLARRVQASHPFVRGFFTTTAEGRLLALSDGRLSEARRSIADRSIFREAMATGEARIGPPQPLVSAGPPVVLVVVPALDSRGAGVVGAELDPAGLSDFLGRILVGDGMGVALVTPEGAVVARSATAGSFVSLAPSAASVVGALVRQRGGVAESRGDDGSRYVVGAAGLARTPWTAVAGVRADLAYASARRRLRESLLGLAVATLLALVVASLIGRQMSGSVAALMSGVRGLVAGQAPVARVRTTDELAELAEQFNRSIEAQRIAQAGVEARQRRLQALAEVNLALSQQLDPDPLLQQITDALARLTGAHNVVLWEVRAAERRLVRRAWTTDPSIPEMGLPENLGFDQGATGWIAATREPVFVDDVTADPRVMAVQWAVRHELLALAGAPVVVGDELVGVLSLNLKRDRALGPDDQELLLSFASQAAVAVHNARLFAEAESRRRTAEALTGIAHVLAQTLDPDVVGQRIAESVLPLFGAVSSGLFRLQADGSLRAIAWGGLCREHFAPDQIFPPGVGVMGRAVAAGAPEWCRDVLVEPGLVLPEDIRGQILAAGHRAILAVPLRAKGEIIGGLYIAHAEARDFSSREVSLLEAFAAQAVVALENARLYVEATRRRREAEELARTARTLTESLDVADVGKRIVEGVLPLFRASFSRLRLKEPDGSLRALAWAGTMPDHAESDALPPGVGVAGQAVARGQLVEYADALTDPGMVLTDDMRRILHRSGARAILGVPLRVRGEIIGSLTIGDQVGRTFSGDEAALAEAFADQAALALDNAHLYEQTRQRLRQVDSLRSVLEQILVPFSLDERLNLIARKAAELLGADRASVALRVDGGDGLVVRAGFGLSPDEVGRRIPLGEGGLGVAAARREGVLVNDYPGWPQRQPFLGGRPGIRPTQAALAYPLLIRDEVIGALSVEIDTRERRFTEADLEQLASLAVPAALAIEHSRLYEELGARLRQLQNTQAQLVQAGKLSALGQLVSGVAHELNNPLSVVIGHGQLLLAKELPPEFRRPVELIVAQGERMARIVQGLLLFSRQRAPSEGPVDVPRLIGQVLDLRKAHLRLSGIRVDVEHEGEDVCAAGDAHQIQQVFLNLLLNAEQAILDGRVGDCIRVRTQRRMEGGREWVVAEIGDNGPGIPPEVLPRIFEPFFTTKTVGKGTGLGLSVSYGIVEQHGGRLLVESRPGHTEFTVELPATTEPLAAPASAKPPRAIGAGRRALLVEDEPAVVDLISTLLRETGWEVDVSPGGRPAVERVRGGHYDLVVSDMRMPEGSGEEFYRAATAERQELASRFLFVTGDTANPTAWAFLEGARAPVLAKPFPAEALLRAVERLFT